MQALWVYPQNAGVVFFYNKFDFFCEGCLIFIFVVVKFGCGSCHGWGMRFALKGKATGTG